MSTAMSMSSEKSKAKGVTSLKYLHFTFIVTIMKAVPTTSNNVW